MKIIKKGIKRRLPREWLKVSIRSILDDFKVSGKSVNFIFVGDAYIKKLNREYLGNDVPTDVIAFPFGTSKFLGEVYVSTPTVARNAKKYGSTFEEEVVRVAVHGLLHLLGYEDKTPEGQKEMYDLGEKYIRATKS